jgi:hypothetical protein
MILTRYASGLNFDIEPKEMTKPKGSANTSVSAKIEHVILKPSSKFNVTCQKVIANYFLDF